MSENTTENISNENLHNQLQTVEENSNTQENINKQKSIARVVYNNTLYFQQLDEEPVIYEYSDCKLIESDDQVYIRKFTLQKEKKHPLGYGWIENPSTVILKHDREILQKIPSQEEKESMSKRCIIVYANDTPFCILYRGDSLKISLVKDTKYTIESSDTCKVSYAIVPM